MSDIALGIKYCAECLLSRIRIGLGLYTHIWGIILKMYFYVFDIVFVTSCIYFYFVLGMLHFCIAVCFISSLYLDFVCTRR